MMEKRVLVTGASGLVGRTLIPALVARGHSVHALSRSETRHGQPGVTFFVWDVDTGHIDPRCLDGVGAIVHLAGENIAARPWSDRRKRALVESRTKSIALLYEVLEKRNHGVQTVVSASASGYYEPNVDAWMSEDRPPADNFLGQTGYAWERAVAQGQRLGVRTVSMRSGVVLANEGGLYPKFAGMVKRGLGSAPGSGDQWLPWIHVDDAVAGYLFALEHHGVSGVYNMAAPGQVPFRQFLQAIAHHYGKPLWLPNIPRVLLKAMLGQLSELLVDGTRMSVEKLRNAGFRFKYPEIGGAVAALASQEASRRA